VAGETPANLPDIFSRIFSFAGAFTFFRKNQERGEGLLFQRVIDMGWDKTTGTKTPTKKRLARRARRKVSDLLRAA
jgi:hypothetical protein